MNSIKTIGIIVVSVICLIIFITSEDIRKKIFDFLSKKIIKNKFEVRKLVIGFCLIIFVVFSGKLVFEIRNNIFSFNTDFSKELLMLDKTTEISENQLRTYSELMESDTNLENCKNPYIPENFSYVEGEWNTGFVIQDAEKNQFVWVPCTNIDNKIGIPILEKHDFNSNHYSNNSSCYEQNDYEAFIKSSLENGGFYISRFEIGKENNKPVSKKDVNIWTKIDWTLADKLSREMYTNINSRLINGFAFDTAVSFIYDEIDLNNIIRTTGVTGNNSYKNIFDLADDMFEWTSEMRHQTKIIRGCVFEEKTLVYFNERFGNDDDFTGDLLSFRTIIYK